MTVSVEAPGIVYGESYRDRATGFSGAAVGVWDKWLGPTQVCLAKLQDGKLVEQWFDLERLERGAADGNGLGFVPGQ